MSSGKGEGDAKRPGWKEEEALQDMLETDFTDLGEGTASISSTLSAIVDSVMNRHDLLIGGQPHRIVELEAYLNTSNHPDRFAHGDDLQLQTSGSWYFHRQGKVKKSYKSWPYMGLDLTLGASRKNVGGLLIRSIVGLASGDVTEGPCTVVQRILDAKRAKSISDLVSSKEFKLCAFEGGFAALRGREHPRTDEILRSPRYGLTLKRDGPLKERWIMAPYRFVSAPKLVKKQRNLIALSLHCSRPGATAHEISGVTGVTLKQLEKNLKLFNAGKSRALRKFYGQKLKTKDLIEMYGAWTAKYSNVADTGDEEKGNGDAEKAAKEPPKKRSRRRYATTSQEESGDVLNELEKFAAKS